jgi:S-adenosylmethionine:tRNA ribosyltransferase-isomerase
MHSEHFCNEGYNPEVNQASWGLLLGTTSVRSLESLYWIGTKALNESIFPDSNFAVGQWEPYKNEAVTPAKESLKAVFDLMTRNKWQVLRASTRLIIIPGYHFKIVDGMITNFHQPRSTLLLLVSAWVGERWKEIYSYALKNNFRFLSYGDSSLLLR